MMWYAIERFGLSGFKQLVQEMLDVAEYAVRQFNAKGIPAWRNNNSVTIVFPRPAQAVLDKWQIAQQKDSVHIITMPQVTRQVVDNIIDDCVTYAAAED